MTESADSQLTSLSTIGCCTKLVPARFSNSFKAVSKSDFSSGGGLLDMALKEMVRGCDGAEHGADSRPDTGGELMDNRRSSWMSETGNRRKLGYSTHHFKS